MIKVKLESPLAKLPVRADDGSAGWDLSSVENCVIPVGKRRLIDTGLKFTLPPDTYGRIAPRSGLALKHGIDVLAGVCDRTYTATYKVLLINLGEKDFEINVGDRIAQLIITQISQATLSVVDNIEITSRGEGGFGSSGIN